LSSQMWGLECLYVLQAQNGKEVSHLVFPLVGSLVPALCKLLCLDPDTCLTHRNPGFYNPYCVWIFGLMSLGVWT
uniref:Uncharacterized protein n=1 Tax=Crocodylus porosus TaxID=8502 RepID=A0A7M4EY79_CROPO